MHYKDLEDEQKSAINFFAAGFAENSKNPDKLSEAVANVFDVALSAEEAQEILTIVAIFGVELPEPTASLPHGADTGHLDRHAYDYWH